MPGMIRMPEKCYPPLWPALTERSMLCIVMSGRPDWNLYIRPAGVGRMDKKILAVIAAVVIVIAAAAAIMLKPGDKDKEPEKSGYTVSFDANGGSGKMASVTGVTGTYTLPECKFAAPSGHSFAGWGLSAKSGINFPAGEQIEINEDTTIYAKWNDDGDMGVLAPVSYNDGVLPTDKVVSKITVVFESGDKASKLSITNLGAAYYYGQAKMTISVEGSADWSCKAVTVEGYNGGAQFAFTYEGVKYTLTFAVADGTGSGSLDSSPVYTFSTKEKATLCVMIGKVA